MEILLSEKDLTNAIKIYLAHSGVVRDVTSVKFARKISGDDAGITANLELSDSDLDPMMLKVMALEAEKVRGLNLTNASGESTPTPIQSASAQTAPEKPAQSVSEPVAEAALIDDSDIPMNDDGDPFGQAAPLATPEELGVEPTKEPASAAEPKSAPDVDPFAEVISNEPETEPETAPEAEPAEEPDMGNDDVPESSPFAGTDEATTEATEASESEPTDTKVDFAPESFDETVQPVDEDDKPEAPDEEPVSIFG